MFVIYSLLQLVVSPSPNTQTGWDTPYRLTPTADLVYLQLSSTSEGRPHHPQPDDAKVSETLAPHSEVM
jgi:hypothetical protein